VSKATLYSYFPDKRLLFMEVATTECQRHADTAVATIDMSAGPTSVLRAAAGHLLTFFLSDFGQQMFRICVAESDRFPELGRKFYDSGPCVVQKALTGYFDIAILRKELVIDDLPLAAHQFAELCKADLFPKVIFGKQSSFSNAEIDRVIDGAVATFLARYGAKA
jgi:AcrR family transcriptional regulator